MNREWHDAHVMPSKPTLEQRIAWHLAHAQNCGCRDMPDSIKQALAERGLAVPKRRVD